MNESDQSSLPENAPWPGWVYIKAGAWLMPALVFVNFALLFLVPKFKHISEVAAGKPLPPIAQAFIGASAFIAEIFPVAAVAVVAGLVGFEMLGSRRFKNRWRGVLAGVVPWCLNFLALGFLASLCLMPAIFMPILDARERAYRTFLLETGQLDKAQESLPERLRSVPTEGTGEN
ncbi:MAG: hypothetical protein ACKV19_17475 [Verrucomicrobiales bacterium]